MQEVANDYDLKHRGRELPGFSDYSVYEQKVQELVKNLEGPARDTLKVIRGIYALTHFQYNFSHRIFFLCVLCFIFLSNHYNAVMVNKHAIHFRLL